LFYLWEVCLPDATEDVLRILKKYGKRRAKKQVPKSKTKVRMPNLDLPTRELSQSVMQMR
jgi:hypothetical protein